MTKIRVDEVTVKSSNNKVKIESTVPNANIDVKQSITAKVEPDNYVIASQGYSAGVPGWLSTAVASMVKDSIGTGGSFADALDILRTDIMDQIALGVNQAITQIETNYVSNSALTTTLASEIGASRSAILDQVQTYADESQTWAADVSALKSSFGGTDTGTIEAFIGNVALTNATSKETFASTVATLTTNFNGLSTSLTDTRDLVTGELSVWNGVGVPSVGMVYNFTTGGWKKYFGEFIGWLKTSDTEGMSWAGSASSFLTAPDGSITGWGYADGSGTSSTFGIKAQNFSISDGTTGYTPFSISGNTIQFNGKVSINSMTDNSGNSVTVGKYLGQFSSSYEPAGTNGDTYYNTTEGIMKYHNNSGWVSTKGNDGANGAQGPTGATGSTGPQGPAGSNGSNGSRGPGWYHATGSSWSDTTANNACPGGHVVGDIVTISSSSFSQAKKWNGYLWVAPGLYINGGLIVDGTIDAKKLNVGSINMSSLSGSINWNNQVFNKPTIPTNTNQLTNGAGFVNAGYSGFTHIDANGVYTGTIVANHITTGTLSADRITSGELDITGGTTFTGSITTIGTHGSTVSTSDSLIGTFYINNTFNRNIQVIVFASGRTGVIGYNSFQTSSFAVFANNSTRVFDYGWSSMNQDAKSMGFTYTIPANSGVHFYVRGRKTYNYTHELLLKPIWIGINN